MTNIKTNAVIAKISPVSEEISENSKLKEDLGIDSLRLAQLLVDLEEEFSIEFQLSDLNVKDFTCVADMYTLINKYVCAE